MNDYEDEVDEQVEYVVPPEAERYVVNGSVSVIVEGNGMDWEPDGYVWLPDSVSYNLDEAGALELQFGEAQPAKFAENDEPVNVFVYVLA